MKDFRNLDKAINYLNESKDNYDWEKIYNSNKSKVENIVNKCIKKFNLNESQIHITKKFTRSMIGIKCDKDSKGYIVFFEGKIDTKNGNEEALYSITGYLSDEMEKIFSGPNLYYSINESSETGKFAGAIQEYNK